ncbi:hypothetical protein SDC9_50162 [bioreactor metagenome]|uniref:Uncharacterized protein n=1 Tax=bioreactor metagenome TaxID=1076179 RepID=A0A644WJ32_9ZZZZ
MIIKNNKINITLSDMKVGNDYYFKEENINIRIEENKIAITDISNSLKWGKGTFVYELVFDNLIIDEELLISIQDIMDVYEIEMIDLRDLDALDLIMFELKANFDIEIDVYYIYKKCVNIYNPFLKIDDSRLVIPKKRFGRWQLIKFLTANKTDITDLEIIRDIIETPYYKQRIKVDVWAKNNVALTYKSGSKKISIITQNKIELKLVA